MLTNRKVLIGTFVAVGLVVLALVLSISKPKQPSETLATSSPTSTPMSEEDRALKEQSAELAARFSTYAMPNDPAYYASFRPYVTDFLFGKIVNNNEKYGRTGSNVSGVKSESLETQIQSVSDNHAETLVRVESLETQSGKTYEQEIKIVWIRVGTRWVANDLVPTKSTRQTDF